MIRSTIFSTLALLFLYTLLINRYGIAISRTAQTVEQRNVVKAEEYLFESQQNFDTLILGSSMSSRILLDKMPAGCRDLSFAGLSAREGLELVTISGRTPKLMLIEINTLGRRESGPPFLKSVSDGPIWHLAKTYFPFIRQKYRPVGVAKALFRDWRFGQNTPVVSESAFKVDSVVRKKTIQEFTTNQEIIPDAQLKKLFEVTRSQVEALRKRGTRVIFFEIPMEPELNDLAMARSIRQFTQVYFPESAYHHISLPNDRYTTTDGVHLTYNESARFTAYLNSRLDQSLTDATQ